MCSLLPALILLCCCGIANANAQVGGDQTQWHAASEFTLENVGWHEADAPYVRFPAHGHAQVPEGVWNLSRHSAGISVHFVSDAPEIRVRWSLISDQLAMPHMPATGVSGVDLYVRSENNKWVFAGNGRPTQQNDNIAAFNYRMKSGEVHEYQLYLPLYNGVTRVEIGVAPGAKLLPAEQHAEPNAPIVYYGTSIAQGGCASRPGMAFTCILSRELNIPIINLGFSGSAMLEPGVANLIGELNPKLFVIDALWNAGSLPHAELAKRLEGFARTLHTKHPQTPILFVGQSLVHPSAEPSGASKVQIDVVKRLQKEGIRGLSVLDGAKLYGDDTEGTVDGVHPNDLGMMAHARGLLPALKKLVGSH